MQYYSGFANGTLGEIFQASVSYNEFREVVIVSLPIQTGSICYYYIDNDFKICDCFKFLVNKSKTINSILKMLKKYNLSLPNGYFKLQSQLLIGKGMSSSTSDILASIRCIAKMFKLHLSPEDMIELIEEKAIDSIMFDGFCMFLSRRKVLYKYLNSKINFKVCYIDEGYSIDTDSIP